MAKQVKLNIPVTDLGVAVQDKEYMLALTLNAYIKLCYRSSVLKDASTRKVMQFAGIGYGRAKAALDKGLERGLFSFVGNDLYASKLSTEEWGYYCSISATLNPDATIGKKRCGMSFTELSNKLRSAYLLNHISKLTECADSINGYQNGLLKPSSKRAKAVRRMSDKVAHEQLSVRRAAEVVGVSKTTVRKYLKGLVASGECSRDRVINLVSEELLSIKEAHSFCDRMNKLGVQGWLFAKRGKVYVWLPNIYRYKGTSIKVKYTK